MYQPKKYQKKDHNYIFNFIQSHPFATFVINGNRLLATHIPVLTEGDAENFRLFGHIANHNQQFQYLKDGTEALVIFQGPHAYVSSSWYKQKDISTWDYSAVHVNVRLKLQSTSELEENLKSLVKHFEKDQDNPLYYNEIPDGIVNDHLPQITGFWCEPFKVDAIAKLHQGFDKEDISRVTSHLEKQQGCQASALSKDIKKEHNAGN